MKIKLACITLLFLISCNQQDDISNVLKKTNLSRPEQYHLIETKSEWAIGEGTENYILTISHDDYKRIVNDIKGKIFFKHLYKAEQPILAFGPNTDTKQINESACWYDNKFFYQIFNPNPGFTVTVVMEEDSFMYVTYEDL